jgi:hypothetical protein
MRKHFDQVPQTIKLVRLTDAEGFLIDDRALRKHFPLAFTEQSRILAVALGRKAVWPRPRFSQVSLPPAALACGKSYVGKNTRCATVPV